MNDKIWIETLSYIANECQKSPNDSVKDIVNEAFAMSGIDYYAEWSNIDSAPINILPQDIKMTMGSGFEQTRGKYMQEKIDITIDDQDYIIAVLSYTPADPGKISGPPEDCYPPEEAEAYFDLVDSDGFLCNAEAEEYREVIMAKIIGHMDDMADDEDNYEGGL